MDYHKLFNGWNKINVCEMTSKKYITGRSAQAWDPSTCLIKAVGSGEFYELGICEF